MTYLVQGRAANDGETRSVRIAGDNRAECRAAVALTDCGIPHHAGEPARRAAFTRQKRLAALLGSVCFFVSPAQAQTNWTGAIDGNWFTGGNWSAGTPNAASTANINTNATPNAPTVGAAGAQSGIVSLGTAAGQQGNLTITGSGTLAVAGGLFAVGDRGMGTLTVEAGGSLTTNTFTTIGNWGTASGTATVTGAGSIWTVGFPYFVVGDSGTGTLNIENGGRVVSAFTLVLGNDSGARGEVNLSGNGSSISVGGTSVGFVAGSTGELTVTGPGVTFAGGTTTIGGAGGGTFTFQGGATGTVSQFNTGENAIGVSTITGAGTTLTGSGQARIGGSSTGTLNVQNGATLLSNSAQIGLNTGASGTVNIDAGTWTVTNAIQIGQAANSGSGTLNIENGGVVGASSFTGFNSAAVSVDGTGSQLNLPGVSTAATTFTLGGSGANNTLDVTNGGALNSRVSNLIAAAGAGVIANVSGAGSAWNATAITIGGAGILEPYRLEQRRRHRQHRRPAGPHGRWRKRVADRLLGRQRHAGRLCEQHRPIYGGPEFPRHPAHRFRRRPHLALYGARRECRL